MDNSKINQIMSYVAITSVFITGTGIAGLPFGVYWFFPFYVFFIAYALYTYRRVNLKIIGVLTGIIIFSLITYKSDLSLVIKQLINISVTTLVFHLLFLHENRSIERVVQKYASIAKVILVIGFIQVLLFAIGLEDIFLSVFPFQRDTNISYRFQSLSQEPAFISLTFAPLVFVSLHNIFYHSRHLFNLKWSLSFVIAYILTFSASAYLAMTLMLCLLYFKNFTTKKLLLSGIAISLIFLFGFASYNLISMVKIRVDDTFLGLTQDFKNPAVYTSVNLSTYSLLSNWHATKEGLEEFPMTGRGLGTHEVTYDKAIPQAMKDYSVLNSKDANSLALRLLSETGVIGFIFFWLFVLRYKTKFRASFTARQEFSWMVNTGIFAAIMIILLRDGNYTSNGKILFFILYYFSNQCCKMPKMQSRNKKDGEIELQ